MPTPKHQAAAKAFIETLRPMLDPWPSDLTLSRINPKGSESEYQVSLLGAPVMDFDDAFLRHFATEIRVDAGEDLLALSDEDKRSLLGEAWGSSTMVELAQAKGVALFKESGIKWERLEVDNEGRAGVSFRDPNCPLGGYLRFRVDRQGADRKCSCLTFHTADSPEDDVVDFSDDNEYYWLWGAIKSDLLLGRVDVRSDQPASP